MGGGGGSLSNYSCRLEEPLRAACAAVISGQSALRAAAAVSRVDLPSVCAQCCAGVGGTHTQSETLRKTSKKWHHARNEHWDPAPSSRVHWAQRERYASVFISQPVDSVKFLVVMWNKHGGIFVIFSGILLLSETDFSSQSRSGAWVRQHSTDNLRRPNNCFDKKSKTENFLYQKSYWKQVGLFLHYASLEWYQALSLRC